MSPKRGDRAAPPPRAGEYDIRFADNQVAAGWEQLCAQAVHNTRRAWEAITADPRPKPPSERHHQLKHALATRAYRDRIMDQWQYEVTGGGRIWYLIMSWKQLEEKARQYVTNIQAYRGNPHTVTQLLALRDLVPTASNPVEAVEALGTTIERFLTGAPA